MPQPKVTLVTWTTYPIESVYHLWQASKVDGPVPSLAEIISDTKLQDEARDLFWQVLHQKIPVGEHINFVFMLENVSVSFREQMVRHRVGTKVGDRIGVDIIPDLDQSSWWSQSMRIQDMGTFAKRDLYRVPETLNGKTCPSQWETAKSIFIGEQHHIDKDGTIRKLVRESAPAEEIFREAMDHAQMAYNMLVAAGVPMEDAREVIPLGAQHRISWAVNLQTLLHVLGKRGCWILQLGLWGPIIKGMISELVEKVSPIFQTLLAPPCISTDDHFKQCLYPLENARRFDGRDDHPACPLYVCRDGQAEVQLKNMALMSGGTKTIDGLEVVDEFYHQPMAKRRQNLYTLGLPRTREMLERAQEYRELWQHDPYLWDLEAA